MRMLGPAIWPNVDYAPVRLPAVAISIQQRCVRFATFATTVSERQAQQILNEILLLAG